MNTMPNEPEAILRTVAKMVDADGMEDTNEFFETDLLVHINSCLLDLYQVGVGSRGFHVTNETTWDDYLGSDHYLLAAAKDYIYMQTKLVFDPPASSAAQQALKDTSERLLIRLREQLECTETL